MKLITPKIITDLLLTFSNVPEAQPPEPAEWLAATAYDFGAVVAVVLATDAATITHGIYESQVEGTGTNTGNDPTTQGTDLTKWKFTGSTVRWAMFNQILQNQTVITTDRQVGLSLPGGASNFANSPNIAGIFSNGKFTLFVKITPDDATPASIETVFSKFLIAGDQRAVIVRIDTTGRFEIVIYADGISGIAYTSVDTSGLQDATEGWMKIEFDGDNGANSVATFFWSLSTEDEKDLVTGFTQMGDPVTGAQTSIFDSTALFELGSRDSGTSENFAGSIQKLSIYDGIDPDTWSLISEYDRTDPVSGGTSTSLQTGQVWTEQGTAAFTQDIPGIIVEVTPGQIINSIALMNVQAVTIQIIMTDPVDGVVFNQIFNLISFIGIGTIYDWLFDPLDFDINLVVFNLPSYSGATTRVIINHPNEAKCGAMVVGTLFDVGTSVYGVRYGIKNYSQKITDPITGAFTISQGTFKSVADVDVIVDPNRFTSVLNKLTSLRNTATVWVADEDISGTIQFGFYNSFNEIYSNPAEVVCQLSIEGLS